MASIRAKMAELRGVCERDISTHQQRIDSSVVLFQKSLQTLRSKSDHSANNQVKLGKLKAELRELEAGLVRALAVKTRKEAKRMAVADSLSETRIKVDELQKIVRDQASRKDQYANILSQQVQALAESEEKSTEAVRHIKEIQEACAWYNRVLGFRIDGGHGVKFTFIYISKKCPTEEYSFTVRHANDMYTLLDCKPNLNDTEELVYELNKSNGLFKFVRIMRENFQSAASGSVSNYIYQDQDCTSISISAPFSSLSIDSRSKSSLPLQEVNRNVKKVNNRKGPLSPVLSPDRDCTSMALSAPVSSVSTDSRSQSPLPLGEANRQVKKANHGKGASPLLSPMSASSRRRSPRFLAKKQREA